METRKMETRKMETREIPILKFEHVTGKRRKFHLEDISFEVMPGFICGLVGENGAGKTTLLKYILSETCRYQGQILIDGEDIRINPVAMRNKVGYVSEEREFFGKLSGWQNAKILGNFYAAFNLELFKEMMQKMNVPENRSYNNLSRGEKLKFQLAFVIAQNPRLYLLDEATVGMDPVFRDELFEILQGLIIDEQASVLMTSHIASEIETRTDYVCVLKGGKMLEFGESMDIMGAGNTKKEG